MKVRLKTILAGPTLRGQPNQTIDVPDAMGKDLIAGGYATEVVEPPAEQPPTKNLAVETATAPAAPEDAMAPGSAPPTVAPASSANDDTEGEESEGGSERSPRRNRAGGRRGR